MGGAKMKASADPVLVQRWQALEQRIVAACEAAGRAREALCVVAVSKRHPVVCIETALALGLRDFGENYVQELLEKDAALASSRLAGRLQWHAIGALQRNKVRPLVERDAVLHGIDSLRLATRVSQIATELRRPTSIFLQVNLDGEATKSGATVAQLPELVAACRELPGIKLQGLMTLPNPEAPARPAFEALAELAARLGLPSLSMGMSGDFEVAIAAGATHLRIGSTLFGPRPPRS